MNTSKSFFISSGMVIYNFLVIKGSMQCGPCPVEAVKKGEIGIGYDTPFVFAEVNADVAYHTRKSNGRFKKARNTNTFQYV